MSTALATNQAPKGALAAMAARIDADPQELLNTLKSGVFAKATDAEFQALVITANEYHLNPILKELYAFPAKGGGIVPIVSIDGWLKIINRQPKLNGLSVEMSEDGKEATCTIHVKDREHPVVVTEYLDECVRPTEPWKTMPRRMLRHKAIIQAARVAFGIGGVFDEDEGKDAAGMRDVTNSTRAKSQVSATADFETPIVELEEVPDPEPTPQAETLSPKGRQTKERHIDTVELVDLSDAKESNGKTWWTAQVRTQKGNVVEMNTFSSTMVERLGGMIGETIKVTFTQTPKGGFAMQDFEELNDGEEVA